jgi:hypothetical protein
MAVSTIMTKPYTVATVASFEAKAAAPGAPLARTI